MKQQKEAMARYIWETDCFDHSLRVHQETQLDEKKNFIRGSQLGEFKKSADQRNRQEKNVLISR
jgi:hypothetical protein